MQFFDWPVTCQKNLNTVLMSGNEDAPLLAQEVYELIHDDQPLYHDPSLDTHKDVPNGTGNYVAAFFNVL